MHVPTNKHDEEELDTVYENYQNNTIKDGILQGQRWILDWRK